MAIYLSSNSLAKKYRRGLSSLVGLLLILIALSIFTSMYYNLLSLTREYNYLTINKVRGEALELSLACSVGSFWNYNTSSGALTIYLLNNLVEPLQVVGYVIIYKDLNYTVVKPNTSHIIPPLTSLTLDVGITNAEPAGVIVIVLIHGRVSHIVAKKP